MCSVCMDRIMSIGSFTLCYQKASTPSLGTHEFEFKRLSCTAAIRQPALSPHTWPMVLPT